MAANVRNQIGGARLRKRSMPIDITFKKYIKGGLIEVYGDMNDAVKKIIEVLKSFKDNNRFLAFRFMIDGEQGSREVVVWRGPGFSLIAHNCDSSHEKINIYKIFYEVFDVDREGLEYDLTKLNINRIKYVKSDKSPEELVQLQLLGPSGEETGKDKQPPPIYDQTRQPGEKKKDHSAESLQQTLSSEKSIRGAMDTCLIALNKSVEKGCPLSSSDPLEVLERCGVYFNMTGNSYLCILEDFDNCKYLISIMDGSHTAVKCLSSTGELEKLLGRDNEKNMTKITNRLQESRNSTSRRARLPLQV